MRRFRLSDAEFASLGAGRPSPATLDELRRAQMSRHLLLRSEIVRRTPGRGYPAQDALDDPMAALHTAVTLSALRAGTSPPPARIAAERYLTATHDGLTLRLRLEDTDPLRAQLGLTPSPRLDDAAAGQWQELLTAAWRILVTRHRPAAATLAAVLSVLVPIEPDPGSGGLSATSADAFGAVALSRPAGPVALAVGLLHEAQHSLLNAVRTLFDLIEPGAPLMYSPWRDDPRPPFGVLHGAFAYLAVTRFWRAETGRPAAFEFARWRAATAEAAAALLADGHLTAAGERFTRALRDEVTAWLGEPVDPRVARLAAGANAEHRARWRLHNLVVEPGAVAALVEAWRRDEPPPALPPVRLRSGGGRSHEQSERLRLVHRWLRGDQGLQPGSRVRPGDAAWLGGDLRTARQAYRQDLLGLVLVSRNPVLSERPELVRDLRAALGEVNLEELAGWLAGSLNSPLA